MKKFIILFQLVFLFISPAILAQSDINSYKYVIVSNQFPFQKSANQYQINGLTKFLFKRAGFKVLNDNVQFPADLVTNRCLALNGIVKDNSGMFTTKVTIELRDCSNKVVFTSEEGKSSEKNYNKAYNEAIRAAFKSIEKLNYHYVEGNPRTSNPVNKIVEPAVAAELPKVKSELNKVKEKEIKNENVENTIVKNKSEKETNEISGRYTTEKWGLVTILKNNNLYEVTVGDEFMEIAQIYPTSKSTIFIIKWNAFKQPRLLEMTDEGNLKADNEHGVTLFKKIN